LLALRTVPQQPVPGWMPASVAMLRTLQLDFASALEGYGSWFEATEGEGEEGIFDLVLDDIKHEPGGPQLDIRADLIAQFTGPVYMASFVDRSAEIARETSAVAIKVKDAALVTESIRRFFSGDPDIITPPPSIGEHVVWNYRNARKPKDGKKQAMLGPDLSNVAVTVAHGYLIAAGNLETLRRVVESPDGEQPLSGDPRFSRARSLITELASGEPILWQFDRGQSSLLSTYDLLRAGRPDETSTIVGRLLTLYFDIVAGSAGKRPAGQPTPRWPGIDFEKLPPFEKVSHHLRDTVLSAENLEQGWLLIGTTVPE